MGFRLVKPMNNRLNLPSETMLSLFFGSAIHHPNGEPIDQQTKFVKTIALTELQGKREGAQGFPSFFTALDIENQNRLSFLKIVKHPYLEAEKIGYVQPEEQQPNTLPFEDWSPTQQQAATERLEALRVPLDSRIVQLIYSLLQKEQQALCRHQTVSYPARYEAIAASKKGLQWTIVPFELEISSAKKANLIFQQSRDTFIEKGANKEAWKVYALEEPALRVETFSVPYASQQSDQNSEKKSVDLNSRHFQGRTDLKLIKKKVPVYEKTACNEEESFSALSLSTAVARVHQIYYYSIRSDNNLYRQQVIEMDFYSNDLASLVFGKEGDKNSPPPLTISQKINYSLDILRAVMYVHQKDLIFRDLKLENFLVEGEKAYLTDFGYCTLRSKLEKKIQGTCHYLAPEVILSNLTELSEPYVHKIDVWAVGCMFWFLWLPFSPCPWTRFTNCSNIDWNDVIRLMNRFDQQGQQSFEMRGTSLADQTIRALIYRMLRFNPSDRIELSVVKDTIEALKAHQEQTRCTALKEPQNS